MKKIALIIWTIIILILISWPIPTYENIGPSCKDKIAHIVLFGQFAYLTINILHQDKIQKKYHIAFLITLLFIILCELIQHFLPYRDSSFGDIIAGIFGTIIFLSYFYAKQYKK